MSPQNAPDFHDIIVSKPADFVQKITLNRPQAHNALCTNLLRELAHALDQAANNGSIRAVVITGGNKVFAAGADINEMADHDANTIREDIRPEYWARIRDFPKPIIAAVNGFCLGGGNELAMHADVIIAGHKAIFGQPEINLGIIPGAGGTQRLLHAVGKSRSMQMILADERLSAEDAQQYGLVSEVVPQEICIQRALELASKIASKPPIAAQKAKAVILQAYELSLSEALNCERDGFCELFATDDRLEGLAAFKEKRKPRFTGT